MPKYTTSYSAGRNERRRPTHPRKARRSGAQYLNHSQGFGRSSKSRRRPQRHNSRRPYAFIAVACAAVFFLASVVWYMNRGVDVSLNGSTVQVRIHSTISELITDKNLSYKPGNLLAVDDSVLKRQGGEKVSVTLNGKRIADSQLDAVELTGGEELKLGDGRDEYEEHEVQATTIEPTVTVKGTGAVQYVETWGVPGRSEVWVGKQSGKTQDRGVVKDVVNCVVRARSVTPDKGKYVALTFDEGPSSYTEQIIKILQEKGASATFFVEGSLAASQADTVKAIANAGFELGSNGYSNATLTGLSGDDLRSELTGGFDAITKASGASCALLRPSGGAFNVQDWAQSMDVVSGVVSWNVDSGDWLLPGADTVVSTVMGSVSNGNIVLLSDNESTGAQTVQALPSLLDQLAAEGYKVVSVSELVATDTDFPKDLDFSKVSMPKDASLPQVSATTENTDK